MCIRDSSGNTHDRRRRCCEQAPTTTVGDQGHHSWIETPLRQPASNHADHSGQRNLADSPSRLVHVQPQTYAHLGADFVGQLDVETHPTTEESPGVDIAQEQQSVGDSGFLTR